MISKTDFDDNEGPFRVLRLKNKKKECMQEMLRGWLH